MQKLILTNLMKKFIISISKRLSILLTILLLLASFHNKGQGIAFQDTSNKNSLIGFDEKLVLKEFRLKEGSEIKYPSAYASFLFYKKQEFIGKKNGTWQKSLAPSPPSALSGVCGNIDFETGDNSGWTGYYGDNPGCCATLGFLSNGVNAAVGDAMARHTVTTGAGLDPCGGFPIVAPSMPGYVPGLFSFRLGNAVSGGKAESIETVFTPTASNNVFTYQYAVVLENPDHDLNEQPFFRVEMMDVNGIEIPCTSILYVAGTSVGFLNSPSCTDVQYKPWATVGVDLVGQIGNPITIRFISGDCTLGGHYGYGYVNCECSPLIVTQQNALCVGASTTLTAPFEDSNTYDWIGPGGPYSGQIITITQAGTYSVTMVSASGCIKVIDYVVTESPTAFVNALPNQTICSGDQLLLNGTIGGAASMVNWTGGTGIYNPNSNSLNCTYIPSAAEITAGTFSLTLTTDDPIGPCPAASDQTDITINLAPTVAAGPDQTICFGNTVTLAGSIGGSAAMGTWSGGLGTYAPNNNTPNAVYTPTASENTAGIVNLNFTTDDPTGPCLSISDQILITINQLPTANAGSAQYVCSGTPITLGGSIGGAATSGSWTGGSGSFSPGNTFVNAVYTASQAEFAADSVILTLTTDDPTGPCSSSSSNVILYFYQNPVVNFSVDIPSGCPIHCVNFTDITTVGGGDTIVSWSWDFGDGSSGLLQQNPSYCFSDPGFYDIKLIATSNHNCASFLSIPQMIQVFYMPIAEFTPSPTYASVIDPVITFNNQSTSDVNYWHWDFGDSTLLFPNTPSPVHTYPSEVSSNYLVTLIVKNSDGCIDTVEHDIFIGPEFTFYIPNVFTPNGDGINDYFFGSGIGIIKYNLWIFNRWGDLIFNARDINQKWDGIANDGENKAQIDVYIWKVKLTDVFNKTHYYIGTVSIVE